MSATVIPFGRPASAEPDVQTGVGPAFCINCKHEWVATAPTGMTVFECPSCQRVTGHFKFEFAPAEDQLVRECTCGNHLFYLTPEGHCPHCQTAIAGRFGPVLGHDGRAFGPRRIPVRLSS